MNKNKINSLGVFRTLSGPSLQEIEKEVINADNIEFKERSVSSLLVRRLFPVL